jgi:hypothetical protein
MSLPLSAQQTGVSTIAESGGMQVGCVRWRYAVEPNATRRHPDRITLRFTFENSCDRPVHVALYSQKPPTEVAGRSGTVSLAPRQTYGARSDPNTGLVFTPSTDRYLNFWVFQSDQRFNIRNGNMPNMQRCNPGFRGGTGERVYPPCPPKFVHR